MRQAELYVWTAADAEGNWEVAAASPVPYREGVNQVPRELTLRELSGIRQEFVDAGAEAIDVSTGQVASAEQPVFGRSYQTPYAHLYDPSWTLHAAADQDYDGPGAPWPLS